MARRYGNLLCKSNGIMMLLPLLLIEWPHGHETRDLRFLVVPRLCHRDLPGSNVYRTETVAHEEHLSGDGQVVREA